MIHNIGNPPIVLFMMYKRDLWIKSGGPNAFMVFPREDYSRTEISSALIATHPLAVIWNMHHIDHRSRSPQWLHYCTITMISSESSSFGSEWVIEATITHGTQHSRSQYVFALIFTQFSQASLHQSSSTNMTKAHNKCIIEFDPQYSTRRRDTDLLWWQIIVASLKYRAEKMMYTWTCISQSRRLLLLHLCCTSLFFIFITSLREGK